MCVQMLHEGSTKDNVKLLLKRLIQYIPSFKLPCLQTRVRSLMMLYDRRHNIDTYRIDSKILNRCFCMTRTVLSYSEVDKVVSNVIHHVMYNVHDMMDFCQSLRRAVDDVVIDQLMNHQWYLSEEVIAFIRP